MLDRRICVFARRGFLVLSFVGALVLTATPSLAVTRRAAVTGTDLTSAEECARCHEDIHRYWKGSLHAQAADNSRFQAALAKARQASSGDPGCLSCHAPAAVYMRDVKWEKKTSWEGVTCDFCHSVRAVRIGTDRPFQLEPGRVKTGPLRDVTPTEHEAAYSDVYTSSTLCAPCHQYVNDRKIDILSTYAEWQASPYAARETTCQSCHMRATTGNVVDPKVKRSSVLSVNLHEMPGGHSVTELNRALQAQISAERKGDTLDVSVTVTNRGAGHKVPTGSPLRSIVLVIEADNGVGARQTVSRTFARVIVDETGKDLGDEAGMFMRGAKTVSDTRLAPGERRVERASFAIPRGTPARAVARLFYRYGPAAGSRVDSGLPFLSVSAWIDAIPSRDIAASGSVTIRPR
ncbi:MAG TPA: multiheme c-type cytochrome [Vicinamibacterales bacterium]|jgi:hypothetical protein